MKTEPHASKKFKTGMFRLIQNVSVLDVLIDRFIFQPLNDAHVADWPVHAVKVGMGLDDPGLASIEAMASLIPSCVGTDVSGWDWAVSEDLVMLGAEVLVSMLPKSNTMTKLVYASCLKACRKVWAIPGNSANDAILCVCPISGVWETGSYLTALLNSINRQLLYHLAMGLEDGNWSAKLYNSRINPELPRVMTMGDDALESWPGGVDLISPYRDLGFTVEVGTSENGSLYEFCSTLFFRDRMPYPTSWPRQVYRALANRDPEYELNLTQLRHELRHLPQLESLMLIVRSLLQDHNMVRARPDQNIANE